MSKPACVLVTGAARRIGAEIARTLHRAGYDIALHFRSSATAAGALSDELNAARNNSCRLYAADLADRRGVADLARAILAREPGLAALINNASSYEKRLLEDSHTADWDRQLDTNLYAPWLLCRELRPRLADNRGTILNIVDAHSGTHQPGYAVYDLSRNALRSLTLSMAREFAPAVRVNAVAPGVILWPEDAGHHSKPADVLANIPLGRLGRPADIAGCVRFLVDEAPYITGQVIAVDGGRSAGRG